MQTLSAAGDVHAGATELRKLRTTQRLSAISRREQETSEWGAKVRRLASQPAAVDYCTYLHMLMTQYQPADWLLIGVMLLPPTGQQNISVMCCSRSLVALQLMQLPWR